MSGFIPDEFVNFDDDDTLHRKYRSIALMPNTSSEFDRSFSDVPHEQKMMIVPLKRTSLQLPSKPIQIGRHNFTIKANDMNASNKSDAQEEILVVVVKSISEWLAECNTFHFSHIPGDTQGHKYPTWKGIYLDGSIYCEVDVHIFHGDDADSYIVDVVRVKGDAAPFHSFFQTLKSRAFNTSLSIEQRVPRKLPSLPQVTGKEEDMLKSFEPVFTLCQSEFRESRLEGVKMFYNVFSKMRASNEPGLSDPDFIKACVCRVETLILDEFEDIIRHAILLFGCLSQMQPYKSLLVESNALPLLFQMVDYMPHSFYNSVHIQQECTSIIATLTHFDSKVQVHAAPSHVKVR